ncbi:hypothetical protein FIBSPDRAFT_764409, partial [Athelia psychrophila]
MAHHIVDVRHRPGVTNTAADSLSRQFTGTAKRDNDGHLETVSPDWEAQRGLVNDVWTFDEKLDNTVSALRERFIDEPIFLQVVDAFLDLDEDKPARDKRRARHRAVGYQLDGGKLWRIGDGRTTRSRPRVECVSQAEAVELAKVEHVENGHWRRDLIKLKLADKICSPRLEKSVTRAIL